MKLETKTIAYKDKEEIKDVIEKMREVVEQYDKVKQKKEPPTLEQLEKRIEELEKKTAKTIAINYPYQPNYCPLLWDNAPIVWCEAARPTTTTSEWVAYNSTSGNY